MVPLYERRRLANNSEVSLPSYLDTTNLPHDVLMTRLLMVEPLLMMTSRLSLLTYMVKWCPGTVGRLLAELINHFLCRGLVGSSSDARGSVQVGCRIFACMGGFAASSR